MKLDIKVMDFLSAFQLVFDNEISEDYAIISIRDVPVEKSGVLYKPGGSLKAALNIHFLDVDEEESEFGKGFTSEDAKEIKQFVSGLCASGIKKLIIHCRFGVSRSAAVAAAIEKVYNGDDSWYFNSRFSPNMYVYRKALEAYGMKNDGSVFEKEE